MMHSMQYDPSIFAVYLYAINIMFTLLIIILLTILLHCFFSTVVPANISSDIKIL